jgi:hypothetical protein
LGGTAEVLKTFVPKELFFPGTEVFFDAKKLPPGRIRKTILDQPKGEKHHEKRNHPLQNLSFRRRDAEILVQRPRGHEAEARAPRQSGTLQPMGFDDLRPVFCDELIAQELDNDSRLPRSRRKSAASTGCTARRR